MNKGFLVIGAVLFAASGAAAAVGGGDIIFDAKGTGKALFSHDQHVSRGFACTGCHPSLYVTSEKHKQTTMAQMQKGQSCGACHNGKRAFSVKSDCQKCHSK